MWEDSLLWAHDINLHLAGLKLQLPGTTVYHKNVTKCSGLIPDTRTLETIPIISSQPHLFESLFLESLFVHSIH
ncbi:hypothetical protein E2C01_048464 [Portunus trituberculatus]|uniref:Uncharacterized protein n=1 Tax=Portunus trituberculatus TaxID=210409 RepID=A0A5B7GB76_PORTR|nr:hypothetical protein [Portunus trituberculatus]